MSVRLTGAAAPWRVRASKALIFIDLVAGGPVLANSFDGGIGPRRLHREEESAMKALLSASMLALLPLSVSASTAAKVPEPGTLGLLVAAVGAALYVMNRRRK